MRGSWPNGFQHWPTYLPFPTEIPRSTLPVPNSTAVNWPQSQFAPKYLPPGSASFQPYRYAPNGPLSRFEPAYRIEGLQLGDALDSSDAVDVTDALLDTSVEAAPTETILPETTMEAVDEADPTSFVPFEAELLADLPARSLDRLRRLEALLARLDTAPKLGPSATALQARLLRAHEHIERKLEARLERRAARQGKSRAAVQRGIRILRARRAVRKARIPFRKSRPVAKAKQLNDIRSHFQKGKITRERAKALIRATLAGRTPEPPPVLAKQPVLKRLAARRRARLKLPFGST